jgi:multiple sugar transport system substrate-binding protein
MARHKHLAKLAALMLIPTMVLTACGTEATPTTAPAAAPTDTTAPVAAATDTAAPSAPATDTPGSAAGATATTGGTGTGTSGSTFDPSKVKKLDVEPGATLRITGWSSTPAEIQIVQDQLNRFKQVYPDVTVNYEPTPGDYDAKFKTMISGNTEPDVFYLKPQLSPDLMDNGRLIDLKPYMDQAGVKKSDYYEQLVDIFSDGDKIYGLPKDVGTLVFFYNTDMAKSKPKDNWTWDDYKAWAAENTEGTDVNTKVFGTMHNPDYARWVPFVLQNGGSVLSADGKSAAINSPEAVAALDFYYSMVKDGTAAQAQQIGVSWPGEGFGKKRAVGVSEGGWLIPYLNDPANGFNVKYAAAPLPTGAKGKGDLLFTNAYAATTNSKFPKAAAALVLFLSGPENQREVMLTGFALPTLKVDAANGGRAFKDDPYFKDHPNDAVLFNALDYGTVDYFGPQNSKIDEALNNAIQRVFRGDQSSKEALDQAAQEINDALKQ